MVFITLNYETQNLLVPEPGRRATLSQAVILRRAQEVTFLQFRNSKFITEQITIACYADTVNCFAFGILLLLKS